MIFIDISTLLCHSSDIFIFHLFYIQFLNVVCAPFHSILLHFAESINSTSNSNFSLIKYTSKYLIKCIQWFRIHLLNCQKMCPWEFYLSADFNDVVLFSHFKLSFLLKLMLKSKSVCYDRQTISTWVEYSLMLVHLNGCNGILFYIHHIYCTFEIRSIVILICGNLFRILFPRKKSALNDPTNRYWALCIRRWYFVVFTSAIHIFSSRLFHNPSQNMSLFTTLCMCTW